MTNCTPQGLKMTNYAKGFILSILELGSFLGLLSLASLATNGLGTPRSRLGFILSCSPILPLSNLPYCTSSSDSGNEHETRRVVISSRMLLCIPLLLSVAVFTGPYVAKEDAIFTRPFLAALILAINQALFTLLIYCTWKEDPRGEGIRLLSSAGAA